MGTLKRLAAVAVLCLAGTSLSTASAAADTTGQLVVLYASPHGSGTACARHAPCSLAGAKSRVEQLNQNMTSDIDVDLYGGTYHVPAASGSVRRTRAATATRGLAGRSRSGTR